MPNVKQITRYKQSDFTLYAETENKSIAYFNTLTGNLLNVDKSVTHLFQHALANPDECSYIQNKLISMGFLIPQEEDEQEYFEVLQKKVCERADELFLIILPTEACNCRCVYCCQKFMKSKMTIETEKAIIEFVERNIYKFKRLRVEWFGGEPLLNIPTIERLSTGFINICKTNHVMYSSVMTTNGLNLDIETYRLFKKLCITGYQITLDGLSDIHNRQRVGLACTDTWHTTVENLKFLRDNVKSQALSIMIRTNITKDIFEQRYEYIDFLKNEFGSDKRFRFYFRLASDWGYLPNEGIKSSFMTKEEYYTMLEIAGKAGLKSTLHSTFLQPGGHVCHAARNHSILIDADGNIRKCTCYLDNNDVNLLGHISDGQNDYMSDWWDPEKLEISEKCVKCKLRPLCMGRTCPNEKGERICTYDIEDFERVLSILPFISQETIPITKNDFPEIEVKEKLIKIFMQYGLLDDSETGDIDLEAISDEQIAELDSLTFISMLVAIENEFNIEIPEDLLIVDTMFCSNLMETVLGMVSMMEKKPTVIS